MNIAWIESGLLFVVWWPLFGFAGDIIWPYSVSPQASIAKLYAINHLFLLVLEHSRYIRSNLFDHIRMYVRTYLRIVHNEVQL
jgi:hypothetical protein